MTVFQVPFEQISRTFKSIRSLIDEKVKDLVTGVEEASGTRAFCIAEAHCSQGNSNGESSARLTELSEELTALRTRVGVDAVNRSLTV